MISFQITLLFASLMSLNLSGDSIPTDESRDIDSAVPVVSLLAEFGPDLTEGIGSFNTWVEISNPDTFEVRVPILHSGSAINGEDFIYTPDTVVFPAGSSNLQRITITILDNCIPEPDKVYVIVLGEPTNGAEIGIGSMTINLRDDDPAIEEFCEVAIPANAIVVSESIENNSSNKFFWLCESGDLDLRSHSHKSVIESGGIIHARTSGSTFFIRSGGTLELESQAQNNRIFAEDGAFVTIIGTCNVVFSTPEATVIDNGTETISYTLSCDQLTVDYTEAPTEGCVLTSVIDVRESQLVQVSPNPTIGLVNILHTDGQRPVSIEVYDANGSFIQSVNGESIELNGPPGIYTLRCDFVEFVVMKQVVKM